MEGVGHGLRPGNPKVRTYKSKMHKLSLMSRVFFHHGFVWSTRCPYPRPLLVDTAAGPPMLVSSEVQNRQKRIGDRRESEERGRAADLPAHQTPIKHGETQIKGYVRGETAFGAQRKLAALR